MNTKTKTLLLLGTIILVFVSGMYWVADSMQEKKSLIKVDSSSFPSFKFTDVIKQVFFNSSKLPKKATVVFHFNSTCDLCDKKGAQVSKNKKYFADYNIIWCSNETKDVVEAFAKKHQLSAVSENSYVLKYEKNQFFEAFGSSAIPGIFIYTPTNQLSKQLDGEASIKSVIRQLRHASKEGS